MRRSFRRGTAVVLALAFFGFSAETLIADVHDGDAPESEVAKFGGEHRDERPTHAAPTLGSAVAVSLDGAPDSPSAPSYPDAPGDEGGHAYHSCHCSHAHGGAPPSPAPVAADAHESLALSTESDRAPASAALEPGLRPPIA